MFLFITLGVVLAVIGLSVYLLWPLVLHFLAEYQRMSWKARLFDSSWDLQCIVSMADHQVKVCNQALSRLLGYTVAEIESMNVKQFIHKDDAYATCIEFKRIQSGQITLHFESRWRAKDGSYKPIEWNGVPDLANQLVYFVGRDVGHIKEVFSDLEAKKAAAEMATKSKSEFLAVMSHEIRTPLNGVIVTANLLRDTPLNAEQYEYLDIIRSSGTALLSVINDILDFSRIESKKLELETSEFDLVQCLEESMDLCSGQAQEKQLDLAVLIDPSVPHKAVGDAARLRQILVNLGGNGVKFTPAGEVVMSVELADPALFGSAPLGPASDLQLRSDKRQIATSSVDESSIVRLHFTVRDTGIGVPDEAKERLFQSFSQVDSSTTRRYGGSGLGLAICNALVQLMGGRIWMDSEGLNRGTTFHFVVALQRAPETSLLPSPCSPVGKVHVGRRVLFVDDNTTCLTVLSRYARTMGLSAEFARSGLEAQQKVLSHSNKHFYDAIVLDQEMGDVSGPDVARELYHSGCKTPVIMMVYKHIKAQDRGVSDLFPWSNEILKPVKLTQLQRVLTECCQPQGTQPAAVDIKRERIGERTSPRRLRILLAEDVVVNQRVATMQIQKLGYEAPDVVSNGKEALESLGRRDYDIVLMDVSMPVLDGIEATRRLRQKRPREHGPMVVALTANVFPQQIAACMECGMDAYISKPVALSELEVVLRRAETLVSQFASAVWQHKRSGSPMLGLNSLKVSPSVPEGPVCEAMRTVRRESIPAGASGQATPELSPRPSSADGSSGCDAAGDPKKLSLQQAQAVLQAAAQKAASQPAQERRNSAAVLNDRSTIDILKEEGVLRDVAELFCHQAYSTADSLRNAIVTHDDAMIARVAHSLRGSSASLGATNLSELAKSIEIAAKSHRIPDATELSFFETQLKEVCSALREEAESPTRAVA